MAIKNNFKIFFKLVTILMTIVILIFVFYGLKLGILNDKMLLVDYIKGYDFLVSEVNKIKFIDNYAKKMYMSYISNAIIFKMETVDNSFKKEYKRDIKKRKVIRYVMNDTFKRKIRKMLIKIKFGLW